MSGHVAPHRWADAFAGRLSDAELAALERHASRCPRCQKARERVERASGSFDAIRAQAAPELPWDSVRARVYWSVSKERRSGAHAAVRRRRPARGLVYGALGALAVASAGALLVAARTESPAPAHDGVAARATGHGPGAIAAPVAPAPLRGLVTRIAGIATDDVLVDGARAHDLFARQLAAGSVLATGDARVDVQFGEASAFALGPRSTLELRRFDVQNVELVVSGTVDVEVGPRAPDQRFVVVAGAHEVEVRGTQFRVRRDGSTTEIACRHGVVAVRDRAGAQVEVGAGRRVQIASGAAVSPAHVVALSVDELAALSDASPVRLPVWDPAALATSSAPLEISAGARDVRRDVRVDGIELGPAPLRVRVMPGRHTVEAMDRHGRFRRAGWVDVPAPGAGRPLARLEIPADPPRSAGVAQRRRQLRAGIDPARLAGCTRSIAKAGLTDTYVQIELAVDETGAVEFLNVIDTDLPSATARCVREVLADVRFGAGAAATWRERIDL